MSAATPSVWGTHLEDPQQPGRTIRLDTPAWAAWLDAATTRSFRYPIFDARVGYIVSWMTVRKERRQRGAWYWSVYHRNGAQLQRVYVGRSVMLTQARLEAVAQVLRPSDPECVRTGEGTKGVITTTDRTPDG